ncbi:hypothetical protein PFISCL1PPCAC_2851, partial [Pristionchus fissidentatus]
IEREMRGAMGMICLLFAFALPSFCAPRIPEETMSTVDLIANAGYPVQEIRAVTRDGHILMIHRIPFGRNATPSSKPRPTVFLQHGLLASSADWVLNLPEQSLGFQMADAGFDVYMGNVRGNVYSRAHVNGSTVDRKEYWRFSFDEMAQFDLEAMVDKAMEVSGSNYVHYVGYSQGTMMMFAKLAREKQFAKKIKKFFALAPVVSVAHAKGPIVTIGRELLPEIELFIKMLGEEEFLPSSVITQFITRAACGASSITNPLCSNLLFALVGPNTNQLNNTRLAAYLSHTPAGTSTQNVLHWAQMSRSGRSEMYDYGSDADNLKYYGQTTPPKYDYSQVDVPTYLYHSPADLLSDPEDVEYLARTLPRTAVVENVMLKDFNHIDFVYGLRAATEIYAKIIREIKDHESNVVRD